jgi:hypothetical protein
MSESKKKDYTLRVKGGDYKSEDESKRPTDPVGLSRSILHVLADNPDGWCKLNSVGATALNSAMSAYRLAAADYMQKTKGSELVCTQSEYTAVIASNPTKGICTRIFPVTKKEIV